MLETEELSLTEVLRRSAEAITKYRLSRPELLRAYHDLLQLDQGTWVAKCERSMSGCTLKVQVSLLQQIDDTTTQGHAVAHETNPHSPFRDFRLIDVNGAVAQEGTAAFEIKRRLEHFTEQTRLSLATLADLLPRIETVAPSLGIDPSPLTAFRHRFPDFPYIPLRQKSTEGKMSDGTPFRLDAILRQYSPTDREKVVSEEEPYIAGALITLDHLYQAHWRATQAERKTSVSSSDTAASPVVTVSVTNDEPMQWDERSERFFLEFCAAAPTKDSMAEFYEVGHKAFGTEHGSPDTESYAIGTKLVQHNYLANFNNLGRDFLVTPKGRAKEIELKQTQRWKQFGKVASSTRKLIITISTVIVGLGAVITALISINDGYVKLKSPALRPTSNPTSQR